MNAILKTTLASVLFLGASSLASAQSEPAQVATIKKAEGTVMVDQGKGFVTSKVNAPLNEGDRVITLGGSGAEIVFNDGCRTQLKANNMIVIAFNPGCKAAIVSVNGAGTVGGVASATPATPGFVAPALVLSSIFAVSQVGHDNTPISGQ